MSINFYKNNIQYVYPFKTEFSAGLSHFLKTQNISIDILDYIFCTNTYVRALNKQFLNHNYNTDILTFDYSKNNNIQAELYLSIEQIKLNAFSLNQLFINELHRVMFHGVLHLVGYNDQTDLEKKEMRKKETELISKYLNLESSTWN